MYKHLGCSRCPFHTEYPQVKWALSQSRCSAVIIRLLPGHTWRHPSAPLLQCSGHPRATVKVAASFLNTYTLGGYQGKNRKHPVLSQRRAMSSHRGPTWDVFLPWGEVVQVGSEEAETFAVTVLTAALSFSWNDCPVPCWRTAGQIMQFSDACFPVISWPWCELPWQFPHIRSTFFGSPYVFNGEQSLWHPVLKFSPSLWTLQVRGSSSPCWWLVVGI